MVGLTTTLGSGAMTNSIAELDEMGPGDTIFAIGTNTTECHPVIGVAMLRAVRRGTRLVVADPRATTLAQKADVWLRLEPGTDVALLNGIGQIIVEEGLENAQFISSQTENFQGYREHLQQVSISEVESITGVAKELVAAAARIIGESANVATYYTMGVTQHTSGVDNVLAVSNLALLTGNIGRPKTGVNPLRGQNNVQGACDMGALPDVLPGYQKITDRAVRERFADAWGGGLPEHEGLTIPSVFSAIECGEVKALYIFGENPMRSDPDINHVRHCLEKADFLVVQDIFLTETAQLADVVLPGASFAEKDGTFTSTERRVQRVRKAIEPVGTSKADWQIFSELMQALGHKAAYTHPEEIFDEMRSLTPGYRGISYQRLENESLQWPCLDEDHPGTPILHVGGAIRGTARFEPTRYRPPAELPDKDYPLKLTTGRVVAHYHTGTMTRRCWGLEGVAPHEQVEIHPGDALSLDIVDGDPVRVESRRGTVEAVARVTDVVGKGLVFMTFHYSESSANMLTNSAADPVTQTPELKICAVKVTKLTNELHVCS